MQKYGRSDIDLISKAVEGKTEEQVRAYYKTFWERHQELPDWERVLKKLEKAETNSERRRTIEVLLCWKTGMYKHPFRELEIPYLSRIKKTAESASLAETPEAALP